MAEKKIVQYTIINNVQGEVIKRVNDLLQKGWVPFGGVSIYGMSHAQAMVKYQE